MPTFSDPTDIAQNALKRDRLSKNKLLQFKLKYPDWDARIVHRKRRCSLKRLISSYTNPVYKYLFDPLKRRPKLNNKSSPTARARLGEISRGELFHYFLSGIVVINYLPVVLGEDFNVLLRAGKFLPYPRKPVFFETRQSIFKRESEDLVQVGFNTQARDLSLLRQ